MRYEGLAQIQAFDGPRAGRNHAASVSAAPLAVAVATPGQNAAVTVAGDDAMTRQGTEIGLGLGVLIMGKSTVVALALVLGWPVGAAGQTEQIEYYHVDAVGSVRAVTDVHGNVVRRHDYYAFGEEAAPTAAEDPLRFAGKERDVETGLDYFGARYYASRTGRFTTVDPGHVGGDIFNPQSWNGYAYALSNPLRFVDPLGLEPCQITLRGADAAAAGVEDGGTVQGECVRPKESWSDWFGRNILGLVPFTATLQAPGLGEADLPLVDRSPDLGVSIAAAVVMPRAFSAKGTTLAKTLQSEAGVGELLAGGGKVIAGAGSKVAIRDVARLVSQYGGKAEDWVKISSTTPGLQTHAYRNIVTGVVVELKSKIPGFWRDNR